MKPIASIWQRLLKSMYDFDLAALFKASIRVPVIETRIILLNIGMVIAAGIGFLINAVWMHYYTPMNFLGVVPASLLGFILVWCWASANRCLLPKCSAFVLALLYTLLCSACLGFLVLAVMLTPSPWVLSHQLLAVDRWLGFHQHVVMHWMGQHLWLAQTLNWAYRGWGWEVIGMAPLLALLKHYQRACQYLWLSSVMAVVCCIIYVVWPSLSPASVFPQHMFSESCYDCLHRFVELHHHQHYAFGTCGLIDFPSYHAAMAMLLIWATWRIRYLNIVSIVFNSAIILSTFLLGYHFLIDVLAAAVLVALILRIKVPSS